MLFRRVETAEETSKRLYELTDKKDYGIFNPCMKAQTAVDELCNFFLGEDWYATGGMGCEQVNTEIVYEIERKFRRYKHDRRVKQWKK